MMSSFKRVIPELNDKCSELSSQCKESKSNESLKKKKVTKLKLSELTELERDQLYVLECLYELGLVDKSPTTYYEQ